MPKKVDPELKARAVRLVLEHRRNSRTLSYASRCGVSTGSAVSEDPGRETY